MTFLSFVFTYLIIDKHSVIFDHCLSKISSRFIAPYWLVLEIAPLRLQLQDESFVIFDQTKWQDNRMSTKQVTITVTQSIHQVDKNKKVKKSLTTYEVMKPVESRKQVTTQKHRSVTVKEAKQMKGSCHTDDCAE